MIQSKDNKLPEQQGKSSKKHTDAWKKENQKVLQAAKERQMQARAYEAEWAKQQQKNKK